MKRIEELLIWFWRIASRPSMHISLGVLALGGFICGVLFWGAFNTALEVTNTEKFCTSCHEMRTNVFEELQRTPHFSNRSGVRASCPDCHVPRAFGPKMLRKMDATRKELWAWVIGRIDTREEFDARRADLARDVWAGMKANDSRECRSCHDVQRMNYAEQDRYSARRHKRGFEQGQTCIDCHHGVAHVLPEGLEEAGEASAEASGVQ